MPKQLALHIQLAHLYVPLALDDEQSDDFRDLSRQVEDFESRRPLTIMVNADARAQLERLRYCITMGEEPERVTLEDVVAELVRRAVKGLLEPESYEREWIGMVFPTFP